MSNFADPDLRFCQELVCTRAEILTVTCRFLPSIQQKKLIALHALLTSIRTIPFTVSDPGICAAKLTWWDKELDPVLQSRSQHPVVKSCLDLGIFNFFNPTRVKEYLGAWGRLAPGEPIQDIPAIREIVLKTGSIEAALEVDVLNEKIGKGSLKNAGAALSTAFLLERFQSKLSGASWWVPLDLQARFGVTFSSLNRPQHQSGMQGVIKGICELGLDFYHNAGPELHAFRSNVVDDVGVKHLQICLEIVERRMKKRIRNPRTEVSHGPTVAEVLIAWRGSLLKSLPRRAAD